MGAAAGEQAGAVLTVFGDDLVGADDDPPVLRLRIDRDIGDGVESARRRRLGVGARMAEPAHPGFEQFAVVVDQRDRILRIGLAFLQRHPVAAVFGVESEPGREVAPVDQVGLVDQESLDPCPVEAGGGNVAAGHSAATAMSAAPATSAPVI